jgi:mannose-6-phosphate isomerase-like protein (cupin superfamily)
MRDIMAGEHRKAHARRVVTGVDESGKSAIVADEPTPNRLENSGMTICDIWQLTQLPVDVAEGDSSTGQVLLNPPTGGLVYRVTTKAPDSEWDAAAEYGALLEAMGDAGALKEDDGAIAGLHQSETVDIVTIISGELYAVAETGETLLKQGDSMVLRGTKHSWSNRSDKPVVLVSLQMSATR